MSKAANTSTTDLPASDVSRSVHPFRRALLAGGAAAAALAAGMAGAAGAPPVHPDAELIRLGADLRQAQADLDAFDAAHPNDDLDDAMAPCGAIVQRIEQSTACTLAGLRVKAMAVAWCNGTNLDVLDPNKFGPPESFCTDDRIMAGIVRDLLALAGQALDGRNVA